MFQLKATQKENNLVKHFIENVLPVSFLYGDKPFPEGFFGENGVYDSQDQALRCEFPFQTFPDSAAVEWTPKFCCIANEKTDRIKKVCALDYVFETDGEAELYYTNGTFSQIDDFGLNCQKITNQTVSLHSKSSQNHLPFFNLKAGNGGVLFGLGFTGHWNAVFEPVSSGIHITVSMDETDFYLLPNEWVRNIKVLLIFWEGDLTRSFNLMRNHLMLHCIPTDEKGEAYPPICCMSWGGMKTENHRKYIQFIKENGLKFDCYWMDAGWHGEDHETEEFQNLYTEDWAYNQGKWTVNRCVHPNGLKPISDAVHDAGMKFMLWFGTYICNDGNGWHKEHPEWGDDNMASHGIGACTRQTIYHKIDFNNHEARRYLIEEICHTIEENEVDYYREDAHVWGVDHVSDRVGVDEMMAVQHMYEFWDELHERFPDILIDNCGGGGTRIDLETLKRSYILWRSDYNCHPDADPIGAQVGNYGAGHFVPLINGAAPINPGSTYHFHSGIYGGMGFGLFHVGGFGEPEKHTCFLEDYPIEWHKRMLEQYQSVKPYLSGNFFPLTECDIKTDSVLAYQFDRPDLNGGVLFGFFRQDCSLDELEICPVLENGRYRFENLETGESFETEVKNKCIITLHVTEKPQSVLLLYNKI